MTQEAVDQLVRVERMNVPTGDFVRSIHGRGLSGSPPWFDDVWNGVFDRIGRLGGAVPQDVELGFHLCYSDYQHQRQVELADASTLVRMADAFTAVVPRRIDFLHLPVREDVDAGRYLAPLADLALDPATELYLGLITDRDGTDSAFSRIATARRHIATFGIATECGIGRTPVESVPPLLQIHRDASARRRPDE
ncbi:hypothetical protein [Pseudonocardia asaccharolytica]|uniref:Uncharacterized protein n=1 Tax=Pseudonocardia asaccharolytica DSM 44247 = NBRC 16224 TaxID=1123024 RepID=A0A511D159_9PSEU|nr:hypothetical protein [Pseudonocardia asaccharolytica]GEL18516.1 hypothetical protein PA7_23530 [Pseudonocardia asaccharolytica DSM 44247 = NBRC 16224]